MKIQHVSLDKITPCALNPRVHTQASIDKVAQSIQTFGWQQPIVVDKNQVIIVGHTRFNAAKQLNLTQVPIVVAEQLSPTQVAAYRLADNRTHEEASWDETLLAQTLSDLNTHNTDLSLTGFDSHEIDTLLTSLTQLEKAPPDEDHCPALPEKTVSKTGEVWCLDRHRLMCGDTTNSTHLAQLMQTDTANMIFSDPPYNVNYQGYTKDRLTLSQDNLTPTEFYELLDNAFAAWIPYLNPHTSLYICHSSSYQREFQQALEDHGIAIRTQLIWAKQHFAWGKSRYKFQHEPLFYCHLKGQQDHWYGNRSQSTLWHINKPTANRLHPTMKPVALIERALKNSSQTDDIILDPFGGSGSTLIACEKMGRQARLLEIDPHYIDVIVQRWQDYTGKEAHRNTDTCQT